MFKKKCACGKSEKNFKFDIGPSYVGDCCSAEGYDALGKRISQQGDMAGLSEVLKVNQSPDAAPLQVPSIPAQQPELSTPEQLKPSTTDRVLAFLGMGAKKLTKSKLGELRVEEIKKIAADRGIAGSENMTRAQLTEALLK